MRPNFHGSKKSLRHRVGFNRAVIVGSDISKPCQAVSERFNHRIELIYCSMLKCVSRVIFSIWEMYYNVILVLFC